MMSTSGQEDVQKPVRILIVEDHPVVALALEDIVQEIGCEFIGPVGSGEQAIDWAEQRSPDLVIMDVELKGSLNGIEAAAEIKRRLGIPSVFFSGYGDAETRQRASDAQPLAFVDKSALLSELSQILREKLNLPAIRN